MKHQAPNRAILLTDSCAVDTALTVDREGRRMRGRIQFAPVIPASDDAEIEALLTQPVYGRFPLPVCDTFEHGAVAELRYCFMADVRDVRANDRILALTADALEELEVAGQRSSCAAAPR